MHFTTHSNLVISKHLERILRQQISSYEGPGKETITLNFRDPDYCSEKGGYCPVEIMVGSDNLIWYITEFTYVGSGVFAELAVSSDFDFKLQNYRDLFREYPINSCREYFELWQANFCTYYDMDVYEVSSTEAGGNHENS